MAHSISFLKLVDDAKSKIKECSVDDIYQMNTTGTLDGILIDTREESEFENGHFPNAIHLSKGLIECNIEYMIPNKNQKMYFYCGGGFRSALVADLLQDMGYKNTISVDGGWRAWIGKDYPTIDPSTFQPVEYFKILEYAKSKVTDISAGELHNMLENGILDGAVIDVREDSEFGEYHIPGATHLSKGQIEVKIENIAPNKDQKIYLYCGSGFRSILAAVSLQKMGYSNVVSLKGGIKEGWMANNYPTVQG